MGKKRKKKSNKKMTVNPANPTPKKKKIDPNAWIKSTDSVQNNTNNVTTNPPKKKTVNCGLKTKATKLWSPRLLQRKKRLIPGLTIKIKQMTKKHRRQKKKCLLHGLKSQILDTHKTLDQSLRL